MTYDKENITGIILAGGKSSRMGRDKALLPWSGHSLIEEVAQNIRPFVKELLVVGELREEYKDLPLLSPCRFIPDFKVDQGPLVGLLSGLEAMETSWGFVVSCDMPMTQGMMIPWLMEHIMEGWALVIRSEEGTEAFRNEPMAAVYNKKALSLGLTWLERYNRSIRGLLGYLDGFSLLDVVPMEDLEDTFGTSVLVNINTMKDYEELGGKIL